MKDMASTQLFHNAQPQQFLPANGARNPWTASAQFQTKTTALPQKKPPTIPKAEFAQHDGTSKMWMAQPAQPVQPQKTVKQPNNLPAALHNAMADISPDEFIPVNPATRRWNLPPQTQTPVKAPVKKISPVEIVSAVPAPVGELPSNFLFYTALGTQVEANLADRTETPGSTIEEEITTQNLYKTELCRSFEETGSCRYGTKCQFAHGSNEIRPVLRHPKYKTEVCKTFHTIGTCPYGKRCRFIHSTAEAPAPPTQAPAPQVAPTPAPSFPRVDPKEWSTSWTVQAPVVQRPTPPPVFLAPETKNIVAENFLPSTAPVFLPPQFVQPIVQPVIVKPEPLATVSVEPVPVAPVIAAPPAPAPLDAEEDEDEGLSRRLSIFAQICSNDD
eukprot:TRINITY_DN4823_c0_g1_i2.p1 TRINITY_DN4823_c0_g1~~TRINITY_DN4823_c0_g1_i2.p1  ORF type:complete len:387 (-),score=75.73 TRINITY_DN4823_c0_g1_i2:257-1417(-)